MLKALLTTATLSLVATGASAITYKYSDTTPGFVGIEAIDPDKPAIYVEETGGTFEGIDVVYYRVFFNAQAVFDDTAIPVDVEQPAPPQVDLTLMGFGVTNMLTENSFATIDYGVDYFRLPDDIPHQAVGEYWDAATVTPSSWTDPYFNLPVGYNSQGSYEFGGTFANVFGDFNSVVGSDGGAAYFYVVDAAGLQEGNGAQGFSLFYATPNSQAFATLSVRVDSGTGQFSTFSVQATNIPVITNGPGTSPVPLPAAGWLLIGSFGALAAARRRA